MIKINEEWQKIALGSLLHDVGKLFNRSNIYASNGKLGKTHQSLSLWYYEKYLVQANILEDDEVIRTIIQKHHEYYKIDDVFRVDTIENLELKKIATLVSKADNYSSKERNDEDKIETNKTTFRNTPLDSVFSRIKIENFERENKIKYRLEEFLPENTFPEVFEMNSQKELDSIIEKFLDDSEKIYAESFNALYNQLLFLLEKYLWCLPSDTMHEYADIPLYDHLKTTSAIATANYHFHYSNGNTPTLKSINSSRIENDFIIIGGEFSGIQKYIFSIGSEKYGVKRLRARSFMVKAITEMITYKFLKELNLTSSNILMCSGGKFKIIAQNTIDATKQIEKISLELEKFIFKKFKGEIFIGIDSISISGDEISDNFNETVFTLNSKLYTKKRKKFENIILENQIFYDDNYEIEGSTICPVCNKNLYLPEKEDYCSECQTEIKIGGLLPKIEYTIIDFNTKGDIKILDLSMKLIKDLKEIKTEPYVVFQLKDTNFIGGIPNVIGNYGGHIPIQNNEVMTFGEIANKSTGVKNLGVLKVDVDNLGYIFTNGFSSKSNDEKAIGSVSRISNLSKLLDNFFAKYIEYLFRYESNIEYMRIEINLKNFYVVYSGGDDLLIVAPWNDLILFSGYLNDEFRRYTKNNSFSLSAGLLLAKPSTPFYHLSQKVEELEAKSKSSGKDGITLFDTYIPWDKFKEIIGLGEFFYRNLKDNVYSQSFIYRLLKYTEMAKKYVEDHDVYQLNYISKFNYDMNRNLKEKLQKKYNQKELKYVEQWQKLMDYFGGFDEKGNLDKEKIQFIAKYMKVSLNYSVRKNREVK